MINIDYSSNMAIYEQVYNEIIRLILSKALKFEEKVPSVRELATLTKINPNTIQKAFRALELEGYIYTVKGRGTFVKKAQSVNDAYILRQKESLKEIILNLKKLSLDKGDILSVVDSIYEEREGINHD